MALKGTLTADFADFDRAVQGSVVQLNKFQADAGKVETSLTRMANSLSGTKVIQDATLMAEAVERIGGTSKLTEKELARVGATAQEAAAKLRAMGQDVPPGIQRIADATKNVGTAASSSTSLLSGMAGQLAGMFTIGAVVAFGKSVLAAGDAIKKMADQTGLSYAEVQKLQHVAGQSGSSIESLVGAVQNLQQRLGDDSSGAAGALARLRINADAFNKLDTYSQMTTLADAVRGIKDPTEQASIAAQLFGKSWKEILPAIKAGMKEVGDEATLMGDRTIDTLDRLGDEWARAGQIAKAWGGTTLGALADVGEAMADFVTKFNPSHWGVATSEILKMQAALNDPNGIKTNLGALPPLAAATTGALKPLTLSLGDQTRLWTALGTETDKASAALKRVYDEELRLYEAQQSRIDQLTGLTTQLAAKQMAEDLAVASTERGMEINRLSLDVQKQINKTMDEAIAVYRLAGAAIPAELLRIYTATVQLPPVVSGLGSEFANLGKVALPTMKELADSAALAQPPLDALPPSLAKIGAEAGAAAVQVEKLAQGMFSIGNGDPAQLARDAEANLKRGGIAGTVGQLQGQAAAAARARQFNAGMGMPGYASGGPVTRTGPALLHAGEYVLPKGGGSGGVNVTIANITIGAGAPANAGRELADQLAARLKQTGHRI